MPIAQKRLGATTVVANTDTALYTVPASTEATVATIAVCNRGSTDRTFRIAVVDGAIGAVADEDYLIYDAVVPANDMIAFHLGLTLPATYTILVRAAHAEVNFSAFGLERT